LSKIIKHLVKIHLPVIIVDDGSQEATSYALFNLSKQFSDLNIIRLPVNLGKGVAVMAGLRFAKQKGFTHAFQIDADGQHSLDNIESFIDKSKKNPHSLISGQPVYDASVPKVRKIGRWLTHVWVWIEILSFRITDSMCGYRIYPIHQTLKIAELGRIGDRMDFDTEIMVKLHWHKTPVIMHPVAVHYPKGNLSNFDVLRDNWRITKMHTRLFMSMIFNFHRVLQNKPNYKDIFLSENTPWSSLCERGTYYGLLALAIARKYLGRSFCLILGIPVVFYFYLTGKKQKLASYAYLQKIFHAKKINKYPGYREVFFHFVNFYGMLLDKVSAWQNIKTQQLEISDTKRIDGLMSRKTGVLLLVSHLGNMEICRAISAQAHKKKLHVLLHTKNSKHFNKILKMINPQTQINLIEVTEVGPDTIMYLKERISDGDWVAIAADRVPVNNISRARKSVFLGHEAPFSEGPYILASLLECPVYTAFALRNKKSYQLFIELFNEQISLERGETRNQQLQLLIQRYAAILEQKCLQYPYQWFNFYDFWGLAQTR